MIFSAKLESWEDWGRVYQSIPEFEGLAEAILRREGLPVKPLEQLTPGTNAVFRAGEYVVKIYSPKESGFDGNRDREAEVSAVRFARSLGIRTPEVAASGVFRDRYDFGYTVMEYAEGRAFSEAVKELSGGEKEELGRRLRELTGRMNVPGPEIPGDVFRQEGEGWKSFPASFRRERRAYVTPERYGPRVFVHGDLNGDNLLICPDGGICVLDFADAVTAPKEYEDGLAAGELFSYEPHLMRGYFEGREAEEVAEVCFRGLLLHRFGGEVIRDHIAPPETFPSLEALWKVLVRFISSPEL